MRSRAVLECILNDILTAGEPLIGSNRSRGGSSDLQGFARIPSDFPGFLQGRRQKCTECLYV